MFPFSVSPAVPFINFHSCFISSRINRERAENESTGEQLIKTDLEKYRYCEKLVFKCLACKTENTIAKPVRKRDNNMVSVLDYCENKECSMSPMHQLPHIKNQLTLAIRKAIRRFYKNGVMCEEPNCTQSTRTFLHVSVVDFV